MKIRAALVAVLLVGAATVASGNGSAGAVNIQVRVVMVGDSIGKIVFPLVQTPLSVVADADAGRSPYDSGALGLPATIDTLSTLQRLVPINTSTVHTYIVVQEAAIGTLSGRPIPLAEYQQFVRDVLRWTANRCLVFVYPGYGHVSNGVNSEDANNTMYARTIAARAIFDEYPTRCIKTINWWYQADQYPNMLQADGLHPSAQGAAWTADQIEFALVP